MNSCAASSSSHGNEEEELPVVVKSEIVIKEENDYHCDPLLDPLGGDGEVPEDPLSSSTFADHLDQAENDETEEFKLRLEYLEQNEKPGIPSPIPSAEADGGNSSKEGSPLASATRKRRDQGYTCDECPYRSNNPQRYANHSKTHEEGSDAVPCSVCGSFMFQKVMSSHMKICHSPFASKPRKPRGKNKVKIVKKPEKKLVPKVKKAKKKQTKYYECPECKAFVATGVYQDHKTMHEIASGHNCPKCGWLCKSMRQHNWRWHPKTNVVQMPLPYQIIKIEEK